MSLTSTNEVLGLYNVYMQKVLIHVKKQLSYGHFPAIAAVLAAILKNPMT